MSEGFPWHSGAVRLNRRRILQAGGLVAAGAAGVVGPTCLPERLLPRANASKATDRAAAAGLGPVTAVSRSADMLDVFTTGNDGRVYTAAWQPGDDGFRGWWQIGDLEVAPCSPIGVVSRAKDKLDIFVAGLDGRVYTAAWEPGDNGFRGWWTVGDLVVCPSAWVTAVCRSTDMMDIFTTDRDGRVHTAAWAPGDDGIRGWWTVSEMNTTPGSYIGAVCRSTDKIDLFATGLNGRIYSAAWEEGFDDWHGWWTIGDFIGRPGAPVTAVSRAADKLDIFTTDDAGYVHSAAWEPHFDDWRGWWTVGQMQTPPRGHVSAISRSTDRIDLFAAGLNGQFYTSAWAPGFADWQGWTSLGTIATQPGGAVIPVCRKAGHLDVFASDALARPVMASWKSGATKWSWKSVASLVTGLTDPEVHSWTKVGRTFAIENKSYSRESQGMCTDGKYFYLVSNHDNTLRKFPVGSTNNQAVTLPRFSSKQHVGAPCYYDGYVYVPVQRTPEEYTEGVLKVTADLSAYWWYPIRDIGAERFAWCAVNPLNGRLYTSGGESDFRMWAFDRNTLERRPEDDFMLSDRIEGVGGLQGGCFTARGRLVFVRSKPNAILTFSARNGYCFGIRYTSEYSELEGVIVHPFQVKGVEAQVHVYELDNEVFDDGYQYSYQVSGGMF